MVPAGRVARNRVRPRDDPGASQGPAFGSFGVIPPIHLLRAAGCPKINLQVRTSNAEVLAFYKAIGYGRDEVVSLGKRLEYD